MRYFPKGILQYVLVVLAPVLVTVSFWFLVLSPIELDFWIFDRSKTSSDSASRSVFIADAFILLPTRLATYVFLAAAIGLRAFWYLRGLHKLDHELGKKVEKSESTGIAKCDWICLDLRRRALACRARGDFILFCGVLALMGGIYFVIVPLPTLLDQGAVRVARGIFERQFGDQIDCVAKGECAYKLTGEFRDDRDVRQPDIPDHEVSNGLWMFDHESGTTSVLSEHYPEFSSGERLTAAALSENGATAVVGTNDGTVWMTTDSGAAWNRHELPLQLRERISAAALSEDGTTTVVVGDEGSVWMTMDSGAGWNHHELPLQPGEWITAAALSGDGATAVVGGDEGSVWMTTDSGAAWSSQKLPLPSGERIMAAALSGDGATVIIGDDENSVWMTTDKGAIWKHQSQELEPRERLTAVALSEDGATAIIGGDKGSVWMTTDSGTTWMRPDLELRPEEWLEWAAFSKDGATAFVWSREGSQWMGKNSGESWNRQVLELHPGERLTAATLSQDGATVIAGGDRGSVLLTNDGGNSWNPVQLASSFSFVLDLAISDSNPPHAIIMTAASRLAAELPDPGQATKILDLFPGETIAETASNFLGTAHVFVGDEGTVWMTTNRGATWDSHELPPQPGERLTALALSEDGATAIIGGDEGSVWMTSDSGGAWNRHELPLQRRERLTALALSEDGATAIVGTDEGSVWMSNDRGKNWVKIRALPNENIGEIARISVRINVTGSDANIDEAESVSIIQNESESFFAIKEHSELDGWKGRSDEEVQNAMRTVETLKYSALSQRVSDFFAETGQTGYTNNGGREWFDVILDRFAIVQAATLAVLFFFLQMMIRLYQYNFRMAAFCESRADSLLIAHRFIGETHIRFDDLVRVLAPDSYDFKAPPRSPFERLQRTREP